MDGVEELGDAELALEAVMLGLRTADGIDLEALRSRYGVDLVELNRRIIERYCESGQLVLDVRATAADTVGSCDRGHSGSLAGGGGMRGSGAGSAPLPRPLPSPVPE